MDSSIKDPTWETLLLLRDLTKRTGILHEIQVGQLKMWPLVAFDNATTSEFSWDSTKKMVCFVIQTQGPAPKKMRARFTWLDQSVKALLGHEWGIKVAINGKEKFETSGKKIINERAK